MSSKGRFVATRKEALELRREARGKGFCSCFTKLRVEGYYVATCTKKLCANKQRGGGFNCS